MDEEERSDILEEENEVEEMEEDYYEKIARLLDFKEHAWQVSDINAKNREGTSWDEFYSTHQDNFFKDRHYLHLVFPSFQQDLKRKNNKINVLEIGCGVGNAILPILQDYPNGMERYVGFDISEHAICCFQTVLKKKQTFNNNNNTKIDLFVCDMVNEEEWNLKLNQNNFVPDESIDYCLLVFVLSALLPEKMNACLKRIAKKLKKGGKILFRDYSWGDLAQKRFQPGQRIARGLYLRSDGSKFYCY